MYEDAAPIEADVARTQRDVVLFTAAMTLALLVLLYVAFAGTSRLLTMQNRRLREQAVNEQLLSTDLRRSEERFRSLVRNSLDVNMIVAADGTIAYESPAVERVMGYRAEDRVGRPALDTVHDDDRLRLQRLFLMVARKPNAEATAELRARHADGSWRAVEAVVKNLLADPAVGGVVANYRDVTARKELEDELRVRAFHDALTGLANRALLLDRLEHSLLRARRTKERIAILFLDLDDFKTINDSLGHGEGDRLLVATAERLHGALRAGDTLARMGGDEFAVLVEDAESVGPPVEVAQRLLETLQAPFERGGRELFVHASVGVAVASGRRTSAEELLRNADAAMYIAKGRGKNRVIMFEPGMHRAALARLALKGDLERAIEREEFVLHYQPIVDLASGGITGVEALLRWRNPARRLVLPAEFVPLAEETGLIIPLGRWVLEEACREARRWDEETGVTALTVSVNVSGRQVAEPGFVDVVAGALARTGLAAAATRAGVHRERPDRGQRAERRRRWLPSRSSASAWPSTTSEPASRPLATCDASPSTCSRSTVPSWQASPAVASSGPSSTRSCGSARRSTSRRLPRASRMRGRSRTSGRWARHAARATTSPGRSRPARSRSS